MYIMVTPEMDVMTTHMLVEEDYLASESGDITIINPIDNTYCCGKDLWEPIPTEQQWEQEQAVDGYVEPEWQPTQPKGWTT